MVAAEEGKFRILAYQTWFITYVTTAISMYCLHSFLILSPIPGCLRWLVYLRLACCKFAIGEGTLCDGGRVLTANNGKDQTSFSHQPYGMCLTWGMDSWQEHLPHNVCSPCFPVQWSSHLLRRKEGTQERRLGMEISARHISCLFQS